MAVYSMTGFGRAENRSKDGTVIIVELSSVNRKQLDCSISMPRELMSCESKIQACVGRVIRRGYVKGSVTIENACRNTSPEIDVDVMTYRIRALRAAAAELNLEDDLTASSLLRFPDLIKSEQPEAFSDPVAFWPYIEKTVLKALKQLKAMRRTEGNTLESDLRRRFEALRKIYDRIAQIAPEVPASHRKTFTRRLEAMMSGNAGIDQDLIAREVAIYADRCDISEELTRLESHFGQADKVLNKGGVCGRTLDFICQEMFREINTIGSKSGSAVISRQVINFKAGLEAVREQVQNIE
ncbi:MAG: YicC/YloC family endoribonuclease [Kiritimatiellia bacterium]